MAGPFADRQQATSVEKKRVQPRGKMSPQHSIPGRIPKASESVPQAAEGETCIGRIMSLPLRDWEDFIGPDGERKDEDGAHLT